MQKKFMSYIGLHGVSKKKKFIFIFLHIKRPQDMNGGKLQKII